VWQRELHWAVVSAAPARLRAPGETLKFPDFKLRSVTPGGNDRVAAGTPGEPRPDPTSRGPGPLAGGQGRTFQTLRRDSTAIVGLVVIALGVAAIGLALTKVYDWVGK
jgi:hypothetical protein